MAEVFIFGQLLSANGFTHPSLFCKWKIHCGMSYIHLITNAVFVTTPLIDESLQTILNLGKSSTNYSIGSNWKVIEGLTEGQTQVDDPEIHETTYWCHPIDLHFVTKGIQGWPKLEVQVWHQDWFGRCNICSYGFIHMPSQGGYHQLKCHTWRPIGSISDQISQLFTDEGLRLTDEEIVISNENRSRLQTQAVGSVSLQLYVIYKNFEIYGIEI